jgi:hypothetical protein
MTSSSALAYDDGDISTGEVQLIANRYRIAILMDGFDGMELKFERVYRGRSEIAWLFK